MTDDPFDRETGEMPWRKAEVHGVKWMQELGFADAAVTQSTRDNGVDVEATDAHAQVKLHSKAVRRPDIQRIRGAAYNVTHAIVYSHSGYTADALAEADRISVSLFDVVRYDPLAVNVHAKALVDKEAERLAAIAAAHAKAERMAEAEVISDRFVSDRRRPAKQRPSPTQTSEPSQAVLDASARYEALRKHAEEAALQAKRREQARQSRGH